MFWQLSVVHFDFKVGEGWVDGWSQNTVPYYIDPPLALIRQSQEIAINTGSVKWFLLSCKPKKNAFSWNVPIDFLSEWGWVKTIYCSTPGICTGNHNTMKWKIRKCFTKNVNLKKKAVLSNNVHFEILSGCV